MIYMEYENSGYVCLDGISKLFTDNGSHEHLFKYVDSDISSLEFLFEEYVSLCLDIKSFEVKAEKRDKLKKILERLKRDFTNIHPYYKYEFEKIIIKELASYFNAILVHALYVDRSPALNPEISKEWYCERIHTLMSPIPVSDNCRDWNMGDYPEGMYPSDFYNSFIKQTQISEEACDYWDEILINAPRKPPVFYNEIMTQKKIYNMLHFGLDASVNSLKGLLPHQRLYFYELLFGNVTVKRHFSFKPQLILNEDRDSKKVQEYNKILKSIHDIREINMAHMDNIPPYLSDDYEKILQYVSSFTNTETYKEYEIDNLYQLLYLEILSMIKNKTKIRKCENCGKYFIVSKENIRYCHRLDENGTPCSVVGPQKAFKEKSKSDLALDGYIRAYKTHYARFQRGILTTEELKKWRITAKEKLELVRSGKLSTTDYIQWLKA